MSIPLKAVLIITLTVTIDIVKRVFDNIINGELIFINITSLNMLGCFFHAYKPLKFVGHQIISMP